MGQGLNQIQINMSGDRPANLTGSFQEGESKQVRNQALSSQHKIKLNSSVINHQTGSNFARLNSEQNVVINQSS